MGTPAAADFCRVVHDSSRWGESPSSSARASRDDPPANREPQIATAADVVRVAVEAEQLGYHDAGGNDHLSTQRYVREAWPVPPDYFEPLVTLAHVAARTSVVRLTTGILVLPMRDPVLLAKQVATLDQLSGGRVTLAVAVGGYRDEFEAVAPDRAGESRAALTREGIEALRCLFTERRSTYRGRHRRFEDVESFPKPVQSPLPIFSGGNAEGALRRAGELCDGWLPAKIGPDRIREGREVIARHARAAGRDPMAVTTALQSVVCLGDTAGQARERFERSAFDLFRRSLQDTMTKGVSLDACLDANLVGTPDEVCAKVAAFAEAGLDHFCATLFVGNTVDEMLDQMRMFARYVIPAFPEPARAPDRQWTVQNRPVAWSTRLRTRGRRAAGLRVVDGAGEAAGVGYVRTERAVVAATCSLRADQVRGRP